MKRITYPIRNLRVRFAIRTMALSVILLCFVCTGHATESTVAPNNNSGKFNVSKVKKLAERLEQNSPDGKHTIIFTQPVDIDDPESYDRSDPYWKKIEVYKRHINKLIDVEKGAEAYMPNFSSNKTWSPDGRYMAIWFINQVGSEREITTIHFLDVCTGTWEDFKSKKRWATTDNFTGWREDKPHTMLLIGEPPKWEDYLEALPINEPDPDDCK